MSQLCRWLLGFVFVIFTTQAIAQGSQTQPTAAAIPRILLVGDSWPALMWQNRSFKAALEEAGLGMYEERGSLTAISGSTAADWASSNEYKSDVFAELQKYPTIDIVHLSLGGNDLLRTVTPIDPEEQIQEILRSIIRHTETVVDSVLIQRPNIRVLWTGYDYTQQGINGFTIEKLNKIQIEMNQVCFDYTQNKDRFFYLSNLGLMQALYGCPPHFKPGELPMPGLPPLCEPFAGGNPLYASPSHLFIDPIHLNSQGYKSLAQRCINAYYRDWLIHPLGEMSIPDWKQLASHSSWLIETNR